MVNCINCKYIIPKNDGTYYCEVTSWDILEVETGECEDFEEELV